MNETDKMIGRLIKKINRQRDEIEDYETLLDCRAGKLLKKDKRFIVIAADEPYFMKAYDMIKSHEQSKGRWTAFCNVVYQASFVEFKKLQKETPSQEPH